MSLCLRFTFQAFVFFSVLLNAAFAQQTFRPEIYSVLGKDRTTAMLRLGDTHVHAVLGLHFTRDSNVLFEDSNPKSDFVLDVIPGLDVIKRSERLELIGSYRYKFRDNIKYDVQDYQSHNLSATANWEFARRMFLILQDQFEKTADAADAELPERIGRWTNQAQVALRHRTPGEDLETTLSYINIIQSFDTPLEELGFFQNRFILTNRMNVNSAFRFLPKSVFNASLEYGDTRFNRPPATTTTPSARNSDSKGFSGTVGLNSSLTRKLTYLLSAGYSYIGFDEGPSANQWLLQATLNYYPTQKINASLGFARGTKVSTFTNFYVENTIRGDLTYRVFPALEFHTRHSLGYLSFSGPNTTFFNGDRSDTIYQGILGTGYRLFPWASLIFDYQMIFRNSNATAQSSPTQTADFLKHLVTLGLDLYY